MIVTMEPMERVEVKRLIDLSTLRKNPDGGAPGRAVMTGPTTVTGRITTTTRQPLGIDDLPLWGRLTSMSTGTRGQEVVYITHWTVIDLDGFQEYLKSMPGCSADIEQQQPWGYIQTIGPGPEYLYLFEDPTMQCPNPACGAEYPVGQLNHFEDDDYYYSDAVCPKCGALEVADVTYESVSEALKRKEG